MATLNDTANGSNDASGTVLATDDALNVTAGDLIVLLAKCEGATTTVTGSDGQGNTYLTARAFLEHSNGDLSGAILYAIASSTGTITPTATYGAARPFRIVSAYSFSLGAGKTGWALGNTNAAQGTASTALNAGAASATDTGVAVAAGHLYGSRVLTAGTGWTIPAEFSSSAAQVSEYRLITGAGSITGDGTLSGVVDWVAQVAIFTETSGVATLVKTKDLRQVGPGIGPGQLKFAKAPRAVVSQTNVDVTLTGASVTVSAGTVIPSIAEVLSGTSITVSSGALTSAVSQAINGSAITATTGVLAPGGQASITGIAVSVSLGTATAAVTQAISGNSIAASAGTLTVAQRLYGVMKTFGPGSVGPFNNGQFIRAPRGFSAINPNVAVSITGLSATVSAGTLTEVVTQSLSGNLVTFSQGTVTTGSDVAVSITGLAITSAIGTSVSSITESISGQSITVSTGTLTEAITVALTGGSIAFGLGTVSPSGGVTAATITIKAGSWLRYKAI